MAGTEPPAGGDPDSAAEVSGAEPAGRASRGASALRWQTAIAAGIAAVATVVAALIV